ncbi:MAG: L,D-transpeptidase family protein [Rhodomicrobium sp.]
MKPRSMKRVSAFLGLLAIAATASAVDEALAQSLPVIFEDISRFVDRLTPNTSENQKSVGALLAEKQMRLNAPIFVRIYKEESELEVWKLKDGRFQHLRTYPICAWSGDLGPKLRVGDRQAPEGFYTVGPAQMNPSSQYHLAFNIGFPNAYDSANGHTGSAIMVHGDCKSVGCFAMTDARIEEIYALARAAFAGGQKYFHVHIMPFRMTAANMASHRDSPWHQFWARLKEGSDSFEATGKPPIVKVCGKQYMVNVSFSGAADPDPGAPCPLYAKIDPSKLPGADGAPAAMLAGLSKPGAQSHPAWVTAAAIVPAAPASEQASAAAMAMPASLGAASAAPERAPISAPISTAAVADRSAAPLAPKRALIASAQTPKPPASPVYDEPVRRGYASSAPVSAAPAAKVSAEDYPIQFVNRSGKSGKLPIASQSAPLSVDGRPALAAGERLTQRM